MVAKRAVQLGAILMPIALGAGKILRRRKEMNHVFYHSKCYDGFGSAYAHWLALKPAQYHPVSYGYPPPDVEGDDLFILDFSYPPDVIDGLLKRFKTITILDHHKTAEASLKTYNHPQVKIVFDMSKSGALLTWEYFHSGPPLELIKHISDRDLWRFEMSGSKEVHQALTSYPMDFNVWSSLKVPELIKEGETLLRQYHQLVENICEGSWIGKLAGHDVPMVNTTIAWSEVGEFMLAKYSTYKFVASFTVFNDQVMWSLRSRTKEDFDVSEIAKKFGGGGHKNAAGFKTPKV